METGIFFGNVADAYPGTEDELVLLVKTRELGFSYIELDLEELIRKDETFFVKAAELDIGFSLYAFTDENCRLKNGLKAEDCLDFLKEKNISNLMVVFCNGCEDRNDRELIENAVSSLNHLSEKAEEYGISILVEDFDSNRIPCGGTEDMLYFGKRIPKLKYTFDTGNFAFFGEDVIESLDKLSDRIRHVHLKDRVSFDDLGVAVTGNGSVPIAEIIKRLVKVGYDGKMSVEMFGAVSSPDDLASALDFVKNCCEC